jgi:hypothetical protein
MTSQQQPESRTDDAGGDFARQAKTKAPSFLAEFLGFLLHNKKWWLAPIILLLLLLGALMILAGTGAAPFIYTLF